MEKFSDLLKKQVLIWKNQDKKNLNKNMNKTLNKFDNNGRNYLKKHLEQEKTRFIEERKILRKTVIKNLHDESKKQLEKKKILFDTTEMSCENKDGSINYEYLCKAIDFKSMSNHYESWPQMIEESISYHVISRLSTDFTDCPVDEKLLKPLLKHDYTSDDKLSKYLSSIIKCERVKIDAYRIGKECFVVMCDKKYDTILFLQFNPSSYTVVSEAGGHPGIVTDTFEYCNSDGSGPGLTSDGDIDELFDKFKKYYNIFAKDAY